ncbi:MAG: hypothetical protein NT115_14065 [Proteobacteria bacterium]|nr:hypothetical protein [Pseudomonadota bacterium]
MLAALVADQPEQVYRLAAARIGKQQRAIVFLSPVQQPDFV